MLELALKGCPDRRIRFRHPIPMLAEQPQEEISVYLLHAEIERAHSLRMPEWNVRRTGEQGFRKLTSKRSKGQPEKNSDMVSHSGQSHIAAKIQHFLERHMKFGNSMKKFVYS